MRKVSLCFLWTFYVAVISYVFFAVLHINTLENFAAALIFEIIGFVFLALVLFCNVFSKALKIGYFVPLVVTTVVYTIVLNVVNIVWVSTVSCVLFILIHLVALFVYFIVSVPMYLMGKR